MSTITYFPYEQELKHFINSVDISDYEPPKNWGGWNEKIHGNIIWKHSPESIKQMSESSKGIRHTAETRAKMVKSHTGLKQSSETVEKRRLKLIGKKRTPEQRKRMSEAAKNRKKSISSFSSS